MAKICRKIVVQAEDLEPSLHEGSSSDCAPKTRPRKKIYNDHVQGITYQYHCPVAGCIYDTNSERSFTCIKYLRQHYQKIHATKVFFCERCKKGFVKSSALTAHAQSCGSTFTCSCGYEYSTRAALLTHAKRKMHTLPREQQSEFRKMQRAKQQTSPRAPFRPCVEGIDLAKPPMVIIFVNGKVDVASRKSASASPSPSSSPTCDAASLQKPCFILPKPAPLDSLSAQAIAAMALSELSTGSCIPKRISVGIQTSGVDDCVCRCRDPSNTDVIAKRSAETQTPKSPVCKRKTELSTTFHVQGTQTALPADATDLSSASTQTLLAFGSGALLESDMFGNGQAYPYGGWPLIEASPLADASPLPLPGVSPFSLANDKFSQTMEDLGVSVTFPLCAASTQTSPGFARLSNPDEQLDQSLHCYLGMDNFPSLQDYAMDSPSDAVQHLSCETQTDQQLDALFLAAGEDSDTEDEAAILSSNIHTQTSSDLESMALQQLISNMKTQASSSFLFPELSSLCNIQTQTVCDGSPSLVNSHTQTQRDWLLGFAAPQIDSETQTLLEGSDTAFADSHTQTSTDILALLNYCSESEVV